MTDSGALFASRLRELRALGLARTLQRPEGVDFCTNDYLGLSKDARVVAAAAEALREAGAGAPASRLLGGERDVHARLERDVATWLGCEAALLFASGWHANTGLLPTIVSPRDVVLSDRDNHASLIDGLRLSPGSSRVFAHNDPADLERLLRQSARAARRWIVVESVYSMDGSRAPLERYAQLAEAHDAWLVVDEAHAVGLFGPDGAGLCAALPDASRVAARVVTGGKALGVAGALVAGSQALVDLLISQARAFVYSTAVAPPVAAALQAAVSIARTSPELREAPVRAATRLREGLTARGVDAQGHGPLVFVPIGAPQAAVDAADRLQARGLFVRAVRPPTVPEGRSGLRLVCRATHTDAEVDRVVDALADAPPDVIAPAPAQAAPRLVVVGTDTDVGKTIVSAALVRALRRAGTPAQYWKPVQTGDVSDSDTVAALADGAVYAPPAVALDLPASIDQAARAEGRHVRVSDVRAALDVVPSDVSLVLETAGGVLVPFNDDEDQGDFLRGVRAPVVLVARSGLGTLNHTRLTVEALLRRRIEVRSLILVGPAHAENVKTLRTWLPQVALVEMPTFEALTPEALDAWSERVGLAELLR